jgi:hypothetical protein
MKKEITVLIKRYANVYKKFESFQKGNNSLLPSGDQKTGVIAEYYAKCYIEKTHSVIAEYAVSGESCDLRYKLNNKEFKIQVKAVSAHSKTRIMAPLNLEMIDSNQPFDFLYLISLDENFIPDAFYINTFENIRNKLDKGNDARTKIQGAAMKGKNKKGYWLFDFNKNQNYEMIKALSLIK